MRRDRFRYLAILFVGALWAYVGLGVIADGSHPAKAQGNFFESSPGPLSQSHAKLDGQAQCAQCHTEGKKLSNDKCLACHDHQALRDRIRKGEGFHASSKVRGKKCENCHTEHAGRRTDIMGWAAIGGTKSFNHNLTGWPLKGKHAAIDCEDCHKEKNRQGLRTYMGLDSTCGSCHKKDSPHKSTAARMMKCERCHTQSIWNPNKRVMDFDHNKKSDASFPIEGSHKDVSCGKCHPKSRFKLQFKDPGSCANCHDSPHDRHLFGTKKCDSCHSPRFRRLKDIRFDHGRQTHFDLVGAHARLDCYGCHTDRLGKKKPKKQCESCHADDNKHKNRFSEFGNPPACGKCHSSSTWKKPFSFNHNRETKFALTGKHAEVECRKCHRGKDPSDFERFDPKTVGCMGCHEHTNVHNKQYTDDKCLGCHKMAGGIQITPQARETYHGPKSRFPLVKGHANVPCEKCHKNDVYKATPMECGVMCHEDSLHQGRLGNKCTNCHEPGDFSASRFDHATDTDWPLIGFHQSVPSCEECHPGRVYKDTPKTCGVAGCHGEDDAHNDKLGDDCGKCHRQTGENVFNHNEMAAFKLTGKHLTTRCAECHPSIEFKPQPKNCFGCHPEPLVHKGQFGTRCEGCHNTTTWKGIQALHDVGDFSLRGMHDRLACQTCHGPRMKKLQGTGNLCITCHRQDDIHANSLSPRCGKCHTQWSFAPARFQHATVGCILTGLHRTLPCADCHKAGNFRSLSPTCYGCHRDEALKYRSLVQHQAVGFQFCGNCHNINTWYPAAPLDPGANPNLRSSVCL
ncbi:MAG TPA: hypothetical protein VFG83_14530 [Kofleriaceae bacterium]|nr:hypothetical protein [Kofleriaceae bacterium]